MLRFYTCLHTERSNLLYFERLFEILNCVETWLYLVIYAYYVYYVYMYLWGDTADW